MRNWLEIQGEKDHGDKAVPPLHHVPCMAEPDSGDRHGPCTSQVHGFYRADVTTEDVIETPLRVRRLPCFHHPR